MLSVMAFGLMVNVTQTQAGIITITDGDFSNWSFGTYGENGGTATISRGSSGGNPGAQITTMTVTPGQNLYARGTGIKNDFSMPAPLANTLFVLRLDVLSGAGAFGDGQAVYLLVEQDSSIYAKTLGAVGYPRNWDTLTFQDIFTESSFLLWEGVGPVQPDFSGGTDTRFGFAGANSWSNTVTHYYDNFGLDVTGPSVPVPPTIWLIGSALLGIYSMAGRRPSLRHQNS